HNAKAFIRPSPSAGSLGGVARKTRETIILCEAAGYNVIFVETVGVGQSETAVHSMVDLFLLLQISGAGDELQGIKRGIMEMADIVAITKADGENVNRAGLARVQLSNALQLFPMPQSGWKPRVLTTSAYEGTGLMELWNEVMDFINFTRSNGYFSENRARQAKYWMYESINAQLRENFYTSPLVCDRLVEFERLVLEDRISSFKAAAELLEGYYRG
ncbi:MAG: methylmalonyl Co-A mutase-associated GTPase MeaB, partial [Rikenellaceae bacterium]